MLRGEPPEKPRRSRLVYVGATALVIAIIAVIGLLTRRAPPRPPVAEISTKPTAVEVANFRRAPDVKLTERAAPITSPREQTDRAIADLAATLRSRKLRVEDLEMSAYVIAIEARDLAKLHAAIAPLRQQAQSAVITVPLVAARLARVKALVADRLPLPVAPSIIEADQRLEGVAMEVRAKIRNELDGEPTNDRLDDLEPRVLRWGTDLEVTAGPPEPEALTALRRSVVNYRVAAHIDLGELPKDLIAAVEQAEHRFAGDHEVAMTALRALDTATRAAPMTAGRIKRELDAIAASPRIFDDEGWQFVRERLELAFRALEATDEPTARRHLVTLFDTVARYAVSEADWAAWDLRGPKPRVPAAHTQIAPMPAPARPFEDSR